MTASRDQVATALPGYEIGEELGRGGWGVVLAGRHRQLRREVAIKQLPAAFAADPTVRARFVAEARVLAALDHPHVVPVYDYVESQDVCLLVMEKLSGGTVWNQFSSTGITMPEVCAIVMAACSGLHAAHQKGILHRDVKPENLMFTASRALKVTDFGIAKVLTGGETKATRAGEVLGTPAYMAPEQVQNRNLTPATDVYAVGMMLYELLSGRLPFPQDDPIALLFCQVNDVPRPLNELAPAVPRALSMVTMKALSKNPADRYATTEDLGVAVAEAATESWDPGWLQKSDVQVMASGRMAAVTMEATGTAAPTPSAPSTVITRSDTVAEPAGAPEPDMAPEPALAEAPAPAPARATIAPSTVVRASVSARQAKGVVAADITEPDLVGIEEVVKVTPLPTAQIMTAVALLLVCIAIAFIGLGKTTPSGGTLPPGTLTVAGMDPAAGKVIPVDLKQPVTVAGVVPPAARTADRLKLSFTAAGVPLGKAQSVLTPAGASFNVPLDATGLRYIVPSRTTAQLSFEGGGRPLAQRSFLVRTRQSPLLTVPGIVGIALVLFTFAYIESLLRALRRRRKLVVGRIGLIIVGGLLGVTAVIWAWLIASVQPTTTTAIVCAVIGAAAGTAAGMAAAQMGLRRRMRPRS